MHLLLDQNRYSIVFDNQEEAENAVEILSGLIHDETYENKANRVFRSEVQKAEIRIER